MDHDAGSAGAAPTPRNLTGAGRQLLVDALLDGFDRSGLEQLTRFALDQDLEEITDGQNLRDCAFDLVEWAGDRGRLGDLVTAALAENPGNSSLRAFERDVWSDPRMAAPPPDDPGDGTSRKLSRGMVIGIVAVVAVVGVLLIWLASQGRLGGGSNAGTTPQVTISNVTLRQVQPNEAGDEVLNIAFDHTLINAVDHPIRIEAVALDASTRRPVEVAAPAAPHELHAESAQDGGGGEILVPFPFSGGCIVVRVAAFDDDGDELDDGETPAFDPYDPANPACPSQSV